MSGNDGEAFVRLVSYGVQRGRARALRKVVTELDQILDDPLADELSLKTWCEELRVEMDNVIDHVHEIEEGP